MSAGRSRRSPTRAILLGPLAGGAGLRPALARLGAIGTGRARALRIGVDGGVERWLKLGLTPDIAVGDWDSLRSPRSLARVARAGGDVLTLPRSKDESDLAHALRVAAIAGAREVVCFGVTGGRPDHELATILELSRAADSGGFKRVAAEGSGGKYEFLSRQIPRWSGRLPPGALVSIFALSERARGVTLTGMAYPLKSAELRPSSRGLSNVARGRCSVRLSSGRVVVIIPDVHGQ